MALAGASLHPARPSVAPSALAEQLRLALLWLTAVSGAFVFIEPSPYEVVALATMILFVVTGLSISAAIMPLALVLTIYNIGFSIAVMPVAGQPRTVTWVAISWFLSATCVFFAAALTHNTLPRLSLIVRGYTAGALIAAVAGIGAYFGLIPGVGEIFLRYGRAQGTFNDPNVLGAFLIFPAVIAFQRLLIGGPRDIFVGGSQFLVFMLAIFLSFSRAAWGQLAFCVALLTGLMFITSVSGRVRVRIVLFTVLGALALVGFIAVLLSFDQVGGLFRERASFEQSYDAGPMGRFGRHIAGFLLALDEPFGIGPMQFYKRFVEDPHNAYLNAFMSGGWISGFSYAILTVLTLLSGLRYLFVRTPWQRIYLAVFAAYLGLAFESAIIDSDHWRHYFLLVGLLWGLIAATQRHLRASRLNETRRGGDHP